MKRIVLAVALVALSCARGGGRTTVASPAARGPALAVTRGAFEAHTVLTGELVARQAAALYVPETPMWQVPVRWMEADGAEVKKGQRVFEFDNATFASTLEERKVNLLVSENDRQRQDADFESNIADKDFAVEQKKTAVAKAEVEAAVPEALRPRREWQEKQLALEKARTELEKVLEDLAAAKKAGEADREVWRISYEAARREIAIAERSVAALTLRAPADGILVVSENPRERRKVMVGDSVWPGLAVARIPERAGMQVEAALYDVDDGLIAKGMPAACFLDAEPGRPVKAVVLDIAPIAQEPAPNSLRRTLRAVLRLEDPSSVPPRPGTSVRVEVEVAKRENVLLAPRASLDYSTRKPHVLLAGGGSTEVRLGPCNALLCVVESGAAEGTKLRNRWGGP
ncbi:MAG: HlyD family efflux transporter periplasmic adaptor subunit [Acidobacteriota bacterium]|nr:HlyD family efflux transporter periplasmic adaptor subunit [Acidobacteriota bacterium]